MEKTMIRPYLKRAGIFVLLLGVSTIFSRASGPDVFVHPGLLQSREDLARMKMAVTAKTEPIFSGFELFRAHAQSQLDYKMRGPLAMVGRNPTVGQSATATPTPTPPTNAPSCGASLATSPAARTQSKEIINAWSATLQSITGRDAVLMAGLGPFKMVNAAEIIRYTGPGWSCGG